MVTTEETEATAVSTAPTIPPFHPTPGKCLAKDNSPVELDEAWKDYCRDEDGNAYMEGSSLMSCCGCFKYECTKTQEHDYLPPSYIWTKTVSPLCCQTCDGAVVPGGSVIAVEEVGDKCGTVKTSVCKIKNRVEDFVFEQNSDRLDGIDERELHAVAKKAAAEKAAAEKAIAKNAVAEKAVAVKKAAAEKAVAKILKAISKKKQNPKKIVTAAAIEDEYHYKHCCADETGLHQLGRTIPDPTTCSTRVCEVMEGWVHAAWVTTQLYPGCGCCVVEGKVVPDGFSWTVGLYPPEKWECCRGKVVTEIELKNMKG